MNFIIKTEPLLQKTIGKADYNIVAIKGNMYDVAVSLDPTNIQLTFSFQFFDEDFTPVYAVNAQRIDVVNKIKNKMKALNLEEDELTLQANSAADTIFRAMLAGTAEQRYAAMSQFAEAYGLTLLPLEKQDGIFTKQNNIIE